jgi:hypothetical protein
VTYAIKEKGKQVYVAKEQFGKPGSLMLFREAGQVQYHPMRFEELWEARAYLTKVVLKTRTGAKRKWEVVEYL